MTVIFNRYFIRYFIIYILDHLYKLKTDTMNSRNDGSEFSDNAGISASRPVPKIVLCFFLSNFVAAILFPPYAIVFGVIIVVGVVAYVVNNARKEHKYQQEIKAQQNENSI